MKFKDRIIYSFFRITIPGIGMYNFQKISDTEADVLGYKADTAVIKIDPEIETIYLSNMVAIGEMGLGPQVNTLEKLQALQSYASIHWNN